MGKYFSNKINKEAKNGFKKQKKINEGQKLPWIEKAI